MTVTIGTTTLNVNGCDAVRYASGKLVLKIVVPQTEIGHDELKTLLKENDGDIVKNNDDALDTYTGFSYTLTILDRDDVYECELECISETERKLRDLQNLVSGQEDSIELVQEVLDFLLMM